MATASVRGSARFEGTSSSQTKPASAATAGHRPQVYGATGPAAPQALDDGGHGVERVDDPPQVADQGADERHAHPEDDVDEDGGDVLRGVGVAEQGGDDDKEEQRHPQRPSAHEQPPLEGTWLQHRPPLDAALEPVGAPEHGQAGEGDDQRRRRAVGEHPQRQGQVRAGPEPVGRRRRRAGENQPGRSQGRDRPPPPEGQRTSMVNSTLCDFSNSTSNTPGMLALKVTSPVWPAATLNFLS